MELEVLPAAKGDCLLLHHMDHGTKRLILIDGGPAGVYPAALRPRLEELRQERVDDGELAEDDPLFIDLLIISHIDDDHINGVLALLEAIKNGAPFRIGRIWHNAFTSLVAVDKGEVAALAEATASVTASLTATLADSPEHEHGNDHDLLHILASIPQGRDLVLLANGALKIPINPEFGGKTIEATTGTPMSVDGLKITVIGPLAAELEKLRKDFKEWLAKHRSNETAVASLLASFSDDSVANLSSIVLLVEKDGQRILLTGDARGDKMMKAVRDLKMLNGDGELPVDVLKVPHHGSDRNITKQCFSMFPADHYVFSGDGKHGNPERETFSFLAAARAGKPTSIELTYPPEAIDTIRAKERNKDPKKTKFEPAQHGITPFLQAQANFTLKHPK